MTIVQDSPSSVANDSVHAIDTNWDDLRARLLDHRRRRRRNTLIAEILLRVGIFAAFIGLWYLARGLEWIDPRFVSDPLDVARYLKDVVRTEAFRSALWATGQAAFLGLIVGSLLGIALGLLLHSIPILRHAANPFVTLANALPRPALAPIFVLWFGLGMTAKVAVAASLAVFVLLLNTLAGLDAVEDDHGFLARTLGMSRRQLFFLVQLPSATPSIVAGLRLAAVYSTLGVVVSEMVAAYEGLGVMIVTETNRFNIAGSFGIIFVLALLATVLDSIILAVQRRLVRQRQRR